MRSLRTENSATGIYAAETTEVLFSVTRRHAGI